MFAPQLLIKDRGRGRTNVVVLLEYNKHGVEEGGSRSSMIIIAFVLWRDETYNNQPQKLQHTNKQYWYIMWSVEQLYHAASMSRVGIYRKNMRVQCTMKRGQLYPMKRGVIITFGCVYYVSSVSCLLFEVEASWSWTPQLTQHKYIAQAYTIVELIMYHSCII